MPAIQWQAIEDQLTAWVRRASGLDDQHVILGRLGGDRPAEPYIELLIQDLVRTGRDWKRKEVNPAALPLPAPGVAGAGNELRIRRQGPRTSRLRVQAFGAVNSGVAPLALLSDVVASIDDEAATLDIGDPAVPGSGVGIGNVGTVLTAESRRSQLLVPRAYVDITLHLASEVVSYTTYIESIGGIATDETSGADLDFSFTAPAPTP